MSALAALACAHRDPTAPPQRSAALAPGDDETALDDAWFAGALSESDVVERAEATAFVDATFDRVERHVYDPTLADRHGRAARGAARDLVASRERLSRQEAVDAVNAGLRTYGLSHLGVATPTKLRARFGLDAGAPPPPNATPEAVSAELRGDVGVVRIPSFLVPEIRHDLVRLAFEKVREARALVIDLRGNGGGSASSVVYTAQYVVGPNVVAEVVQTREGRSRRAPHEMRGYFPDAENEGSKADLTLGRREGLVRWWTPADAPPAPRRPTYVLVDERCASSCEVFAAMLVDARAATVLGRKTSGEVLAAHGVKTSWRGYLLVAPFGTVLSPKGRVIEGVGVSPEVPLEACTGTREPEACLAAALDVARGSRR